MSVFWNRTNLCCFCRKLSQFKVWQLKNFQSQKFLARSCSSNDDRVQIVDIGVKKMLDEARISTKSPIEFDQINLDEVTGDFKLSTSPDVLSTKTDANLKSEEKESTDLSWRSVYLFSPGFDDLKPGFVRDIAGEFVVKEVFDEASSVVGFDVLDLCMNGSEAMLNDVANREVAVLVSSLAEVELMKLYRPLMHENLFMTAGISVGEISALVAAGALHFAQAVRLVKERGAALKSAMAQCESGLVLVSGGKRTNFAELCQQLESFAHLTGGGGVEQEEPVCSVAVHLYQCTKVIGGHAQCLRHLPNLKKDFHLKSVTPLKSSMGALHTRLMKPAEEMYAVALKDVVFNDPRTWTASVYCGVTGTRFRKRNFLERDSYFAKNMMLKQLTTPYKWETIANRLAQKGRGLEYPQYFELGPGQFLLRSLRQINNRAAQNCTSIRYFFHKMEQRRTVDSVL